jgi:hypothetical protein
VNSSHTRRGAFGQRHGGWCFHGLRETLLEKARHGEAQHVAGAHGRRKGARNGAQALAIRGLHGVEHCLQVQQHGQARGRRQRGDLRML